MSPLMGNPWKVEIELSYRRRRDRGGRESETREKELQTNTERDDARVGGEEEARKSESAAREGGKMRENKI